MEPVDITKTTVAKSDQLNADDLIGNPVTIQINRVNLLGGDQPVAIGYEGDNGKPWKPCKSMRRVLVHVWGGDGSKYVGRLLTLYRDPSVSFGGQAVGGIRISHMSDIDGPITLSLTVTRNVKKPYTVQPLQNPTSAAVYEGDIEDLFMSAMDVASTGMEEYKKYWDELSAEKRKALLPRHEELKKVAEKADNPPAPASNETQNAAPF